MSSCSRDMANKGTPFLVTKSSLCCFLFYANCADFALLHDCISYICSRFLVLRSTFVFTLNNFVFTLNKNLHNNDKKLKSNNNNKSLPNSTVKVQLTAALS